MLGNRDNNRDRECLSVPMPTAPFPSSSPSPSLLACSGASSPPAPELLLRNVFFVFFQQKNNKVSAGCRNRSKGVIFSWLHFVYAVGTQAVGLPSLIARFKKAKGSAHKENRSCYRGVQWLMDMDTFTAPIPPLNMRTGAVSAIVTTANCRQSGV